MLFVLMVDYLKNGEEIQDFLCLFGHFYYWLTKRKDSIDQLFVVDQISFLVSFLFFLFIVSWMHAARFEQVLDCESLN